MLAHVIVHRCLDLTGEGGVDGERGVHAPLHLVQEVVGPLGPGVIVGLHEAIRCLPGPGDLEGLLTAEVGLDSPDELPLPCGPLEAEQSVGGVPQEHMAGHVVLEEVALVGSFHRDLQGAHVDGPLG